MVNRRGLLNPERTSEALLNVLAEMQKLAIQILHEKPSLTGRCFSDAVVVIAEVLTQRYALYMHTGNYLFNVIRPYLEINATPQRSGEFLCTPSAWMILFKDEFSLTEAGIS